MYNARGNEATCNAVGFIQIVGAALTLLYSCSLNCYYLALIKYRKSDAYIRNKIEPFLHLVPVVTAIVYSITFLVNDNYNNVGIEWADCNSAPIYNPPHCIGYEDGQVRDGFEIPCGRGKGEKAYLVMVCIAIFAPPIIIALSLGMIYRSVSKQEKRTGRYGAGALNRSSQQNLKECF